MYLVQLLLPVYDPKGRPFPESNFSTIRRELTDEFGGVTAYTRSPATGLWKKPRGGIEHDANLLFEVLVPRLNASWWQRYRQGLEKRFRQEHILIRRWGVKCL
jgi:hypothetical protein